MQHKQSATTKCYVVEIIRISNLVSHIPLTSEGWAFFVSGVSEIFMANVIKNVWNIWGLKCTMLVGYLFMPWMYLI